MVGGGDGGGPIASGVAGLVDLTLIDVAGVLEVEWRGGDGAVVGARGEIVVAEQFVEAAAGGVVVGAGDGELPAAGADRVGGVGVGFGGGGGSGDAGASGGGVPLVVVAD